MPVQPIIVLLVIAVLANLVVMGAVLVPALLGRRGPFDLDDGVEAVLGSRERRGSPPQPGHAPVRRSTEGRGGARRGEDIQEVLSLEVASAAFDRVVRIVAWAFLLSASVIISVTGLWSASQPAIYVTLALAGIFVLVVHDIMPPSALGPARFVLEGSAAIVFVTILVILTGQGSSPFFFVYPLIVGGAALVVPPVVTGILALVAAAGYLVAVLAQSSVPAPATVATIGVNLTALCLLAYAGMVIARQQRRTRDVAVRLSTVDSLTGLYNRAYFFAALEREIDRSARFGRGFCLLMIDLDGLKPVNDRFGHFHGDRVLTGVAGIIAGAVRRIDTAARYGGDEFVVLLPETDPSGAYVAAEKIRQGAEDLEISADGEAIRTSLSIGVVSYPDDGRTADALMITADEAMYGSKRLGKNRVTGSLQLGGQDSAQADREPARADREPAGAATRARGRAGEPQPLRPRTGGDPAGGRRFRPVRHDEDEQLRRAMDLLLPDEPRRRRRTAGPSEADGTAETGGRDDAV